MRTPIMKKMAHQYDTLKGLKGTGRKLVHTMDQVLKKLSLQQIQVSVMGFVFEIYNLWCWWIGFVLYVAGLQFFSFNCLTGMWMNLAPVY